MRVPRNPERTPSRARLMYQPRPRIASHINAFSGLQALHTPHGPAMAEDPAVMTATRTYLISWPLQEVPKVNILCPLGAQGVELMAEYRVLWRRFHWTPSAPCISRTGHTRGFDGRDRHADLDRFIYRRRRGTFYRLHDPGRYGMRYVMSGSGVSPL